LRFDHQLTFFQALASDKQLNEARQKYGNLEILALAQAGLPEITLSVL
jgi:hypothetical protein